VEVRLISWRALVGLRAREHHIRRKAPAVAPAQQNARGTLQNPRQARTHLHPAQGKLPKMARRTPPPPEPPLANANRLATHTAVRCCNSGRAEAQQ